MSDKEITCRSGFLNPGFWQQGDSVMADRGFTIEENLKDLGVTLNIPAFLDGRDQLETDEVIESQSIASVRIHVERFITRQKKFKLQNFFPQMKTRLLNMTWLNLRFNVWRSFVAMATNLPSCFLIQFLKLLLKFLANFTLFK